MNYTNDKWAFTIGIGKSNNPLFAIENDGTLWYTHNDEFKKLENEKEIVNLMLCVISGRYTNEFKSKEELFTYISKAQRDGKINDILK